MRRKYNSDKTLDYSNIRSIHKDDGGNIIPFSRIDDYQTSMSNFSTRIESSQLKRKTDKKHVDFNPLISVVNIQSFKKENYVFDNDTNNNEQKCALCSIF